MKRTIKKKRYSKKQNKSKRKFSRKQNKSKRKFSKKQNKSKRKKTIRGGALGENTCLSEQRQLEEIIRENEELVNFSTEINNQNEELKDQNNVLKGQNNALITEKAGLEEANSYLLDNIDELKVQNGGLKTEIDTYKQVLEKRDKTIKKLQENNRRFGDIKCNEEGLKGEIEELNVKLQELQSIKSKYEDSQNKLFLLQGNIERLEIANSDLLEKNQRLEENKTKDKRSIAQIQTKSNEITKELTEANGMLKNYEKDIADYKKSISEKTEQIIELQTQLGVSEYNTDNKDFLQFKSDIRSIINPSYNDERTEEFNRLNDKFKEGIDDLASQLLEDEV